MMGSQQFKKASCLIAKPRNDSSILKIIIWTWIVILYIGNVTETSAQTMYPDGGRNVIPIMKNKQSRNTITPYNDGTVMAHVIGSAGMNFLYYFHILGVSCENTDPRLYNIIQQDFAFCLNKTGSIPPQLKTQPLGSIPKPCVDWKMRKPCYKNLADDYDECLANRPGLARKGTDALRFTHAYAKFICGNVADTEAHLMPRYMKHDMIVDGVFQCFPHLQDRIVNCVKRDKISKTLCSKFYVVHACFGKYYNDDNCHDEQPIFYMDDLFRNMSANLNCPKYNDWEKPQTPQPTPLPGGGWPSTPGYPTEQTTGRGWHRENPAGRENPWPGEVGRPWSGNNRNHGETFIRDQDNHQEQGRGHHHSNFPQYHSPQNYQNQQQHQRPPQNYQNQQHLQRPSQNYQNQQHLQRPPQNYQNQQPNRRPQNFQNQQHHQSNTNYGGYSGEQRKHGRGSSTAIDRYDNRQYQDYNSNSDKPWVDVLDRGTSKLGQPWEKNTNEIDRDSSYSTSPRGSMTESHQFVSGRPSDRDGSYPYQYTNQRNVEGGYQTVTLAPAGFAKTRVPHDAGDSDLELFSVNSNTSPSSTDKDESGYNFYSFK